MKELLKGNAVIAAIKDKAALSTVCSKKIPLVFMLFGNITRLQQQVDVLKENGKRVFVHVDLIAGLRPDDEGIRFISKTVKPDGIISTKTQTIRQAKEQGLETVFRIFMIDASAFDTGIAGVRSCRPGAVEVMPGLVYDVIGQLNKRIDTPIIAGGMIKTPEQAKKAIDSGAMAISTSSREIWETVF